MGGVAHRPAERHRGDHGVNQPPRDEFGRRHSEKLWQEYRPGITAAEPPARLPHPPPPGAHTDLPLLWHCVCIEFAKQCFMMNSVKSH